MRGPAACAAFAIALLLPGSSESTARIDGSISRTRQEDVQRFAQTDANDAREKAEEKAKLPQTSDDGDNKKDDNPPGPGNGKPNIGEQIQDLDTQDTPPKGKVPPTDGHALTPGGDHPAQNAPNGLEIACKPELSGVFQPVQSVYQDDHDPNDFGFSKSKFEKSGPRNNPLIEKKGPHKFLARLPMIAGRLTVVTGVERYMEKGKPVPAGQHNQIAFKLKTNCTTSELVRVHFKTSAGAEWTETTEFKALVRGGPTPLEWEQDLDLPESPTGLPRSPEDSFKLPIGDYTIEAWLVDAKEKPLTNHIEVTGTVSDIPRLRIQFVPVVLAATVDKTVFFKAVEQLKDAVKLYVPDFFPLAPGGIEAWTHPTMDLSATFADQMPPNPLPAAQQKAISDRFAQNLDDALKEEQKQQEAESNLASERGAAGVLGNAQRVVVALLYGDAFGHGNDFERATGTDGGVAARTVSTKVILTSMAPKSDGPFAPATDVFEPVTFDGHENHPVYTVAHELAHSLPSFSWAEKRGAMEADCGTEYHNWDGSNQAWGVRVATGGESAKREEEKAQVPVMAHAVTAPAGDEEIPFDVWSQDKEKLKDPSRKWIRAKWITQCTYSHLIWSLAAKVDPSVLLVRGMIGRPRKGAFAAFDPFYDLHGETDVKSGPIREWGVRLRDAHGAVVGSFPFDPEWLTDDADDRIVAPLFVRIPVIPRAVTLEIVDKGKVLQQRALSKSGPSLSITAVKAPARTSNIAHISWKSAGERGKSLKSSVYYSTNDGKWYDDQKFEIDQSSADVVLDRHFHRHTIKVVVTDGSRSSDRIVKLSTP